MKYIKEYPETKGFSGVYAVYEVEKHEQWLADGRFLVNKKYSKYAMQEFDHDDLIKQAVRESRYTYGTGFCDTIKECDLFYECECLRYLLRQMKDQFEKIGRIAFDTSYLIPEEEDEGGDY